MTNETLITLNQDDASNRICYDHVGNMDPVEKKNYSHNKAQHNIFRNEFACKGFSFRGKKCAFEYKFKKVSCITFLLANKFWLGIY